MRRLAIPLVLAVLALLVVAADLLARGEAEHRVAEGIAAEAPGVVGLEVRVHGLSFLTQLARQRLDHVSATARQYPAGPLVLDDVRVDLYGLTTDPSVADRAELTARVTPRALTAALGGRVDIAVDGDRLTATVPGTSLTATIVPTLADGAIRLDTTALSFAGLEVAAADLPLGLGDALQGLVVGVEVPAGLALTDVSVAGGSVRVMLEGRDVALDSLG